MTLTAAPILAVCMKKRYLKSYLAVSLGVITLYAVGLILQVGLHVHYTHLEYGGHIANLPAWPLLDPNNAATVVNLGLVPCFWMMLRKPKWAVLVAVLSVALLLAESKGGILAAFVACTIISWHRWGETFAVLWLAALLLAYSFLASVLGDGALSIQGLHRAAPRNVGRRAGPSSSSVP